MSNDADLVQLRATVERLAAENATLRDKLRVPVAPNPGAP